MNFYWTAKVWDWQQQAPNTSNRAQPSATEQVHNARVIDVKEAMYRGATFSGTFMLSDKATVSNRDKGWHIVEVYCCWYGLRLKKRGPHFRVNMDTAEVIESYSKSVVSNLSAPQTNSTALRSISSEAST